MRHSNYTQIEENYNKYLENNKELVDKQIKRQQNDYESYKQVFDNKQDSKKWGESIVANLLLKRYIGTVVEHLEDFLIKNHKQKKYITEFLNLKIEKGDKLKRVVTIDEIAYVAIRTMFNNVDNIEKNLIKTGTEITNNIITIMRDNILRELERPLYNKVVKNRRTSHIGQNVKMINNTWGLTELSKNNLIPVIDAEQKSFIGLKLIDTIIHSLKDSNGTQLIIKESILISKKNTDFLKLNDEVVDDLTSLKNNIRNSDTYNNVMIIKPKPWTGVIGGGYINNDIIEDIEGIDLEVYKNKLIKTNSKNVLLKVITNSDMDRVYNAVNTLQETPFELDFHIYELIKELWDNNHSIGGIPNSEEKPLPPKPFDIDTNVDVRKEWRKEAAKVYEHNSDSLSERKTFSIKLDIMRKLVNLDKFYFTYQLDYRGRIYPMQKLVNPQGDDISKAVLNFKNKKALGKNGLKWLKIHTANLFGVDKESYNNRIEWVDSNIDTLKRIVSNPVDNYDLWKEASSPFEFIKSSRELINAIESGNPEEYKTNIAIAIDGSNNGSQHWAIILKESQTAKSVNLDLSNWDDVPEDVYRDVANEVEDFLEKVIMGEEKLSINKYTKGDIAHYTSFWLNSGLINRKLCKRPVMTCAYNVSDYGVFEQLKDYLKKEGHSFEFKAIQFISVVIIKMMNKILAAVKVGMDFLKDVGEIVVKKGHHINWKTPNGLFVVQDYKVSTQKKVDTKLGGVRYTPRINKRTEKIKESGEINGVAANFIHSLDSCHMQNVILTMKELNGELDFWAIHDSFGMHPSDIDKLSEVIRDEFVKLYSINQLEVFRDNLSKTIPEVMDVKLPKLGTFDINNCYNSTYIFS